MKKKSSKVRIALIQMKSARNPKVNLAKASQLIQRASKKGAKIICLQELFHVRYFPQSENEAHFKLALGTRHNLFKVLAAQAKKLRVVLIVPFFEKRARGLYHNSVMVIDADGSVLGLYRKMHIPDDPCFYEKYYFAPGDLGFKVFKTRYGNIGALICWDQWYPEAARLTVLQGADILFYPTAIGWHQSQSPRETKRQIDAWQTIQQSHAIANGVYVASVNRVGQEDRLKFWGKSFVSDPSGEIITRSARCQDEILLADCDLSRIDRAREEWPFLRDRRIDAYQGLTKRYGS